MNVPMMARVMIVPMSMSMMLPVLVHVRPMQSEASVAKAIGNGSNGSLEFSAIEEHSAASMTRVDVNTILACLEHLTVALGAVNGCAAKTEATAK